MTRTTSTLDILDNRFIEIEPREYISMSRILKSSLAPGVLPPPLYYGASKTLKFDW